MIDAFDEDLNTHPPLNDTTSPHASTGKLISMADVHLITPWFKNEVVNWRYAAYLVVGLFSPECQLKPRHSLIDAVFHKTYSLTQISFAAF
ncbi:hypothetical protein BBBOND_0304550 [Babesia bigemina]|uniref:Uncharacterized protein n=1 Tax=Babesia bigemina TaxID=5866 RepID=A0A061D992_BABBI|nr:hypothetical protein BBBOND_0304550 [Babesia bigemina]CDR96552.1 hypothetical protein BBBOND_0304550 [Babesia bigemina]|eukprot:XP_012768738.1 hypothetical protein BBBOND_0304550 [Babesia bigemina]